MIYENMNDLVQKVETICFPRYANIKVYEKCKEKKIDLDNPQTYSEKIRYIMLHSRDNKAMSLCADKYGVRKYLERRKLGFLLNELYGVYNRFEEIDFHLLPDRFVLKCAHGFKNTHVLPAA